MKQANGLVMRLETLKRFLAAERASEKPSKLYIMDLLQSIEDQQSKVDTYAFHSGEK